MPRSAQSDPLQDDATAWFWRLERALREQDYLIATEARRHLARLGWDVRQRPRSKTRKATPSRTACGEGLTT